MTAEIAILNKSAVALAADSKVTISSGDEDHKIFDTADKLFDLSDHNPIGIMVYNGLHFMGVPLPVIIRDFRDGLGPVERVQDAANEFLAYLKKIGSSSPSSAEEDAIIMATSEMLSALQKRLEKKLPEAIRKYISNNHKDDDFNLEKPRIIEFQSVIELLEGISAKAGRADFIDGSPRFTKKYMTIINKIVQRYFKSYPDNLIKRMENAVKSLILSKYFSGNLTGLVFAGFGSKDMFPTLISYEIDGVLAGRLKYRKKEFVDIDRDGTRARILPFAQKDMVERFLYGLDDDIQQQIIRFCQNTIGRIGEQALSKIEFSDSSGKEEIRKIISNAEAEFLNQLENSALVNLKERSILDIEGMVEFMLKPDLARTAEALIDLTSIKRKVSAGMETVGGPIDVAVISRSEGFVWVKRKHYFPPALNVRFFKRRGCPITTGGGPDDA